MKSPASPRQWLALLSVLVLVALAGCGGISDVRETRAPLDVDESEYTARDAVRNGSVVAFDTDRDHAPDPEVLLDAHRDSLDDRSYVVDVNVTVTGPNGSINYLEQSTVMLASNHAVYRERTIVNGTGGPLGTIERYANGTHVWERLTDEGDSEVSLRTSAGRPVSPDALRPTGRETILSGLYRSNVTDVVRVADLPTGIDEPVYRIRATEPASPVEYVENVSVSLTVTEGGRVLSYDYRRVVRNDTGALAARHVSIEYGGVGETTVTRPPWVPEDGARGRTVTDNATTTSSARGYPTERVDVSTGAWQLLGETGIVAYHAGDSVGDNRPSVKVSRPV